MGIRSSVAAEEHLVFILVIGLDSNSNRIRVVFGFRAKDIESNRSNRSKDKANSIKPCDFASKSKWIIGSELSLWFRVDRIPRR